MFLSGVQKALSGFPLKTCGNDICDKDSIFEMSSGDDSCRFAGNHHVSLPLSASVGLSCAILLVGRKLTIVVTINTRIVVPAINPAE